MALWNGLVKPVSRLSSEIFLRARIQGGPATAPWDNHALTETRALVSTPFAQHLHNWADEGAAAHFLVWVRF
jgi:hypothetical protein